MTEVQTCALPIYLNGRPIATYRRKKLISATNRSIPSADHETSRKRNQGVGRGGEHFFSFHPRYTISVSYHCCEYAVPSHAGRPLIPNASPPHRRRSTSGAGNRRQSSSLLPRGARASCRGPLGLVAAAAAAARAGAGAPPPRASAGSLGSGLRFDATTAAKFQNPPCFPSRLPLYSSIRCGKKKMDYY